MSTIEFQRKPSIERAFREALTDPRARGPIAESLGWDESQVSRFLSGQLGIPIGKIDAGLQPFPLSYEAEAAGFNNFGPISQYVSDYLFTSVNVDSKWAQQNRPLVQGFLRALKRGQEEMAADPAGAAAIAARELKTAPALAQRALADTARLKILSPDLSVSDAALGSTFETVLGVGLLPPGSLYERSRMVDSGYLPPGR